MEHRRYDLSFHIHHHIRGVACICRSLPSLVYGDVIYRVHVDYLHVVYLGKAKVNIDFLQTIVHNIILFLALIFPINISISNLNWMGSYQLVFRSPICIGWDPINHLIIYNLASKTEIFQLGRHTLQGLKYIHYNTINKRKIFRLGRHTHQGLKYVSNILHFYFFLIQTLSNLYRPQALGIPMKSNRW